MGSSSGRGKGNSSLVVRVVETHYFGNYIPKGIRKKNRKVGMNKACAYLQIQKTNQQIQTCGLRLVQKSKMMEFGYWLALNPF